LPDGIIDVTGGYKLPPERHEQQAAREQARAKAEHAPKAKRAAKRDRDAALMREQPKRPRLTADQHRQLVAYAHAEAELKARNHAISSSLRASVQTKQDAQRRMAELEPALSRARTDAARSRAASWADSTKANRYVEHCERLEAEASELAELASLMIEDQKRLTAEASAIAARLAPLSALIDGVCAKLGKPRGQLLPIIDLHPGNRPADVITVGGR
jgi:hypothetical protein